MKTSHPPVLKSHCKEDAVYHQAIISKMIILQLLKAVVTIADTYRVWPGVSFFTRVISFDSFNSPMRQVLFYMHRGDKDTEAQRDGETYLVIGNGQDLSGFSRTITNTNWVLTRSQVYCPKCLLFTRNHAPIIIPFFFSGTFSVMWWHQITKCVYCLLTKCQPLYINSPLKSSQQVWMYYLYW